MYHPGSFVGVKSRDSSKKKWRVVRLGFRQRALTGRRERVAFAQGLGKRASKQLAPLHTDAQEAPGEQLPVVGRSSGGAKHPFKLRITRRWWAQSPGRAGAPQSDGVLDLCEDCSARGLRRRAIRRKILG
jgi:hypothetical protein